MHASLQLDCTKQLRHTFAVSRVVTHALASDHLLIVLVRHSHFEHDDAYHRHYSICLPSLDKCSGRAQRGPVPCTECVLLPPPSRSLKSSPFSVGWTSTQPQSSNAGFHQSYDQSGYGYAQQDVGVKVRIINLISAVRTLMRSKRVQTCMEKYTKHSCKQVPLIGLNLVVIVYELILGG